MSTDLIYEYTREIRSLNNQKQRYLDLIYKLKNSLLPELKSSRENLVYAADNVNKYFMINGDSIDKKSIKNNDEKINDIIYKIEYDIISSLNTKVNSIDSSVNYYDYLIRKEKEREADDD